MSQEENPLAKNANVSASAEAIRHKEINTEEFLAKVESAIESEHLTVEQLDAIIDRVRPTIEAFETTAEREARKAAVASGQPTEIPLDPEMQSKVIEDHELEELEKKGNPGNVHFQYYGLRGLGTTDDLSGDTSLNAIFGQALTELAGPHDAPNEDQMRLKVEEAGVTRGQLYELLTGVREKTATLRQENRGEYTTGVLRSYFKRWCASNRHAHEVVEMIEGIDQSLRNRIMNTTVDEFAKDASLYRPDTSTEGGQAMQLDRYKGPLLFFRDLPIKLGPDIGTLKFSEVYDILKSEDDFLQTVKKVTRTQ